MSTQNRDPSEPDPERLSREQVRLLVGVAVVSIVIAVVVVVLVTHSSGHSQKTSASAVGTATVSSPPGSVGTSTVSTTGSTAGSTTESTTTAAVTTGTGAASPAGGPVPAGFDFQSFTAISDTSWWLMGTAPCGTPSCTSIVRTTNGGRSWVGIPAPPTSRVTELRFANAEDGYAYGQELWSTHDGGATWTRVPDDLGQVQDLSIGGGYVYAASSEGIFRSPVNRDDFTVAHSGVGYGVWGHGADLFATVAGSSGSGQVLVISDNSGNIESQSDGVIWASCATGTEGGLWRSVDNGAHWTELDPAAGSGEGEPNSAALAEASASTAVYGSTELYRSTDGGTSWSTVPGFGAPETSITYLGFTDPTHGVAIVQDQGGAASSRLEVTTDGGETYSPVTITSG
jgi:photosystem II stability/assembly factor-like uncharacterized protein